MLIALARVSTEEQAADGNALRNQIKRLRLAGAERIYYDVESRTENDRAGLQAMIAAIAASSPGEITGVLVTRMDRLTASPALLDELSRLLQAKQIPLIGIDERIDLGSVEGEFGADLQVVLAKREVRMTSLRVRQVNELKRKQGKANNLAPWGYRIEDDRYQLDHSEFLCLLEGRETLTRAAIARDLVDVFLDLQSITATVKAIHQKYGIQKFRKPPQEPPITSHVLEEGDDLPAPAATGRVWGRFEWSTAGFATWIRNPVLAGGTPYDTRHPNGQRKHRRDWKVRWGTHDAVLVTFEEHQRILEIGDRNHSNHWGCYTRNDRKYPFSGLIHCGECGATHRIQGATRRTGRRNNYYQCRNYCEASCSQKKMVSADAVESAAIAALMGRWKELADLAQVAPAIQPEPPALLQLREQLAYLERSPGNPALLEGVKQQIEAQIRDWEARMGGRDAQAVANQDLLQGVFGTAGYWQSLDGGDRYRIFRELVRRVEVRDGQIVAIELRV
jgi:DNA invertase Pin-like site-specific DNA recombinase